VSKLAIMAVLFGCLVIIDGVSSAGGSQSTSTTNDLLGAISSDAQTMRAKTATAQLLQQLDSISSSIKVINDRLSEAVDVSDDYIKSLQDDDSALKAAIKSQDTGDEVSLVGDVREDLQSKSDFIVNLAGAASDWVDTVSVSLETYRDGTRVASGDLLGCNPHWRARQLGLDKITSDNIRWPLPNGSTAQLPAGLVVCYAFDSKTHKLITHQQIEVGHDGAPIESLEIDLPK
jgi:hypothetical protein